MTVDPWTVKVSGEVARPGHIGLEDMLAGIDLEERIYRLRCVEAWSMVIPWIGFPVKKLLDKFEPTGNAKFVEPSRRWCTGRRKCAASARCFPSIDWPYRGRPAAWTKHNHPLAIFALGMYGKLLPNQNGAPLRLVVPWKYGFKSIKSIVEMRLTASAAAHHLELAATARVRLLRQRQSRRGPSALEPGDGKADFPPRCCAPSRGSTRARSTATKKWRRLYAGMDLRRNY